MDPMDAIDVVFLDDEDVMDAGNAIVKFSCDVLDICSCKTVVLAVEVEKLCDTE